MSFRNEGGESEFFGFATIEQAEVERSKDGVLAGCTECGHEKDRADLRAAVEDMALTAELALS